MDRSEHVDEISKESAECINNPSSNVREHLIIQKFCGTYYLWKIISTEEPLPPARNEALNSLIGKFIIKFFSIIRADTKGLNSLIEDFIHTLQTFLKNFKVDKNEFSQKLMSDFNNFHSEVMILQNEKTLEVLRNMKSNFIFNKEHKRVIISDLSLDKEEGEFLTKMLETTKFNSDTFTENFIKYFKCFIVGYNEVTEKIIKEYVVKVIQEFNHGFEKCLSFAKNSVFDYVTELIRRVKTMRVNVLMMHIGESQNVENPWEIVYEIFLDTEEIRLEQVVKLGPNHNLITIGLINHKHSMIISNKEYITQCLTELLPDEKIVIASGSNNDSMILFQNNLKKAYIGCFTDDGILLKKEINVFTPNIQEIRGACYLRSNNEVLFISEQGRIGQIQLERNPITSLEQIVPTPYRNISISDCGRFIILLSDHEVYLFSYVLELMYMDHSFPYFVDVSDKHLDIIFMNNPSEISVKLIGIDSENMVITPEVNHYMQRIDSEARKTLKLTEELFKGIFKSKNFKPPENK